MDIIQAKKVRDEERRRIARSLHDGPIQSMTNIIWAAGICEQLMEIDLSKAKKELGKLKQLARNALRELCDAVSELRDAGMKEGGLTAALAEYSNSLQAAGVRRIRYCVKGQESKIPSGTEGCLRAIAQECCTNIRKHAKASNVIITLRYTPRTLFLYIRDDGIGFDYPQDGIGSGELHKFGLLGIAEQVGLINGKMKIKSSLGKGTRILVAAPLRQASSELREQEGK
ncbi:MAG: sensor histidine kinase [bacterium]|jgi:two-component system sensor histidine kinase DegS